MTSCKYEVVPFGRKYAIVGPNEFAAPFNGMEYPGALFETEQHAEAVARMLRRAFYLGGVAKVRQFKQALSE